MRHEMMLIWSNIRTLPPVIRQIVCHIRAHRLFRRLTPPASVLFSSCRYIHAISLGTTLIDGPQCLDRMVPYTILHYDIYRRSVQARVAASCVGVSVYSDAYTSRSRSRQDEAAQLLDAAATRLGTQALFFQALVSLSTNFLAPMFVLGAAARPARPERGVAGGFWEVKRASALERLRPPKMHLATLWALSHGLFALCMEATLCVARGLWREREADVHHPASWRACGRRRSS
jgi:hypothetical protein